MVAALRDRERILVTFGRVVEPVVRDRLLDGGIERGGAVDLRGRREPVPVSRLVAEAPLAASESRQQSS